MMPSWELSGVRTEHQTCRGFKDVKNLLRKKMYICVLKWDHFNICYSKCLHYLSRVGLIVSHHKLKGVT